MSYPERGTNASTDRYIDFRSYNPALDGVPDDTIKLKQAFTDANAAGLPVSLPAGTIKVTSCILNVCSVYGVKGKTIIIADSSDILTSYNSQFVFQNTNFELDHNTNADVIFIKDIIFLYDITRSTSYIGFANIEKLHISGCEFRTLNSINPIYGLYFPFKADSLIDLYASCQNVDICDNVFVNNTGGSGGDCRFNGSIAGTTLTVDSILGGSVSVGKEVFGIGVTAQTIIVSGSGTTWTINNSQNVALELMLLSTPTTAGGGGSIWVRNHTDSADDTKATKNIRIYNNSFEHYTSDECLAVFCVNGLTKDVKVYKNRFIGNAIDTGRVIYHMALISAFPLTIGSNAQLTDITIEDNDIYDSHFWLNVIRLGLSSDTTAICQRITTTNNRIHGYYADPGTAKSPHATWLTYGSVSTDPDTVNCVLTAVQNLAATYSNAANAALYSINDTVHSMPGSGTILKGIEGFDTATNPIVKGSFFYAASKCVRIVNGDIEGFRAAFRNCNYVMSCRGKNKDSAATSALILVDEPSGRFIYYNIGGSTIGGALYVHDSATVNTIIELKALNIAAETVARYCINNASTTALIRSHLNLITGVSAGIITGAGAANLTTSLNNYTGTID